MIIESMTAAWVGEVAELEARVTEFPWPLSHFCQALEKNDISLVAIEGQQCCGFAVFSQVLDELTLLNIAVAPEIQGRGLGREMLLTGLALAADCGAAQCFLEVRQSNQAAIALYRSLGFSISGVRKAYYPARFGREDAFLMSRELPVARLGEV